MLSLLLVACSGGSDSKRQDGITVEVASALPTAEAQVLMAPPVQPPPQSPLPQTVFVTGTPQAQTLVAPTTLPLQTPSPAVPVPTATPGVKPATPPSSFNVTPAPAAATTSLARVTMDGTSPPTTGRWIDVDVTRYRVRLMSGTEATRTVEPVAVGSQVDTGVYASTQTGTFRVYNKIGGLQYDAPYKTYISDWVGFDSARANGFHSLLKDASGNVVDPATGRVSNGCIRVGDSATIFAYAEIGMVVYVHH